jgi:Protein of unknown function (DUF3072)
LFGFEAVSLRAKAIDLVEHPLKKGLGCRCRNPCPLQLKDFFSLPSDLGAHALDFAPDEINVRHFSPLKRNGDMRTKKERNDKLNVGKKTELEMSDNTLKNPNDWVSGDDPMTGAQESYLKTLAEQAQTPDPTAPGMTKAEASQLIDEMREKAGLD